MEYYRTNILTPTGDHKVQLRTDLVLSVEDGIIVDIKDFDKYQSIPLGLRDLRNKLIIPGLIDSHVHLSQWRIRGRYKGELLEWLNTYTFPEEEKFNNRDYASQVAKEFFQELIKAGTTTASIYVTVSQEATNIAFEEAYKLGYRGLIGKVCMDRNSPEALLEASDSSYRESVELCEQWDKKGLLNYIFTPRFAPVCSRELMTKIGKYARENDKYIQTHLAENWEELALVKDLFPEAKSYTDLYDKCHLLGPKTLMAHAIHLSPDEINLLKNSNTKLIHCPDSNFFLKSGRFPYKKYLDNGLTMGLGSDVAGGTNLDMFYHMKMANYTQSDYSLPVTELFYLASLGNAKVLSLDDQIGSIEIGKQADFIIVDADLNMTEEEILSNLIFVSGKESIEEVYIGGRRML